MKKKKIIIGVLSFIFILLIGIYVFTKQDKNTSFTLFEKQWLDNNKSKVIDISVLKDVPVLNYNGDGILFDFLNDFESVTGMDFNLIAYDMGQDINSSYSFQVVDQKNDDDILVYSDSYVLLTKNNVKYNKLSELTGLTVGVLESDLEKVQNAMGSVNIIFSSYKTIDEMVAALKNDQNDVLLDAIILPKIKNFGTIISDDTLNISYNINEIKQEYVLRLGNDEKLNAIIRKYFKKWYQLKYDDSYAHHFSSDYFTFSNTDDKSKALFKSKKYVYGFVDNKPYDALIDDGIYGVNKAFIDEFSRVAGVDIEYKDYTSVESLVAAFNDGSVDFFFDDLGYTDYPMQNVNLISNYDEQAIVLALPSNKISVSSVKSLIGYKVFTLADTKICSYLESAGVNVLKYSNISDLLDKVKSDSVIVIDSEMYNFYNANSLKNYKNIYQFNIDTDYSFRVNDIEDNGIFIKYFNFFLSFVSNQEISNIGYSELFNVYNKGNFRIYVIIAVSIALLFLIGLLVYETLKKRKNKVVIPKDSKIKYIDILTSLKNRNYLNDNIDQWDESLVYPQGIVIVDLNNIAYINDNYGHAEGDKVIKEAANILIKNQVSNTEIIRTNGNEFLIYMVGYDEKQILSYMRKLNKEFKDLSHDFGAAIGYSIITDEIKTIDDAINEATLDMRNNKEESH